MKWQAKVGVIAGLLIVEFSTRDAIPFPWGLLMVLVVVALIWRFYDGFLRTAVGGLVGGAVAGLLVLGPGFRLAMRAVAIMDPGHPEEFSVGGTLFIVVGLGAVLGGIDGVLANLVRRAFNLRSAVFAGSILAVFVMVNLAFFSGEVSDELFQLGLSAWINIPLFSVVALGYGIAAMALADLAEGAMFRRGRTEKAKVPA